MCARRLRAARLCKQLSRRPVPERLPCANPDEGAMSPQRRAPRAPFARCRQRRAGLASAQDLLGRASCSDALERAAPRDGGRVGSTSHGVCEAILPTPHSPPGESSPPTGSARRHRGRLVIGRRVQWRAKRLWDAPSRRPRRHSLMMPMLSDGWRCLQHGLPQGSARGRSLGQSPQGRCRKKAPPLRLPLVPADSLLASASMASAHNM